MGGSFETVAADGAPLASERWTLSPGEGTRRLSARGAVREGQPRRWELEAAVTDAGVVGSMEVQMAPDDSPTEVTTVALRSHGARVYLTRIPPGGVPDRVETAFEPGSLVVGPSLALLAMLAAGAPVQPGMGRRSLFVRLDGRDLSIRLEDGIILQERRVRGRRLDGREGWLRRLDLRTASDAGRAEAVLEFDDTGALLSARWPGAVPPRAARALGAQA